MFDYETAQLLAQITAVDGRFAPATPEVATLAADMWFRCIGDLDYEDARDAVAAYYQKETDRRIMPGDIAAAVKAARLARLGSASIHTVAEDVDTNHPRYQQIRKLRFEALQARPGSPEAEALAEQAAAALPLTEAEAAALAVPRLSLRRWREAEAIPAGACTCGAEGTSARHERACPAARRGGVA